MKERTTTENQQFFVDVDRRELVNIDLYDHEIKVIAGQLKEIAENHPQSKKIHQKVEHLKKELKAQQKNLEKFRKECQPEEMNSDKETEKKVEPMGDKSFFEILNAFENQFKTVRQEATDFVNWMERG